MDYIHKMIDPINTNELINRNPNIKSKQNNSLFLNKQKIIMDNQKQIQILNKDFILNNIYSTDDDINLQLYKHLLCPYQKRLNLMNLILKSNLIIPLNNMIQIIKFFNWLSPLNNEFNMGSKDWAFKKIKYGNKQKFLLQNSISKQDMGRSFYSNYIDLIKKKLSESKTNYYYFEFKSKRFNKIKDVIWVFDL